ATGLKRVVVRQPRWREQRKLSCICNVLGLSEYLGHRDRVGTRRSCGELTRDVGIELEVRDLVMLVRTAVHEAKDGQCYPGFEIDNELVSIAGPEDSGRPPNARRRDDAYSHTRTPEHRRCANQCSFGRCRRP